jgi:hypothetical protein
MALCKKMPVITVNKVVEDKIIIGKSVAEEKNFKPLPKNKRIVVFRNSFEY